MKLIGVDIGGSHISAAHLELKDRIAVFHNFNEADVNTFGEQNAIISEWSKVISKAAGNSKDIQVGIAMPGPFNYEKGVSLIKDQGKMASLYETSVKGLLAERLEISASQLEFTNDAEAFLAGESYAGAGKEFQNSIGITLGTGLGSAIKVHEVVKDAKLWTAPFRDGIAEDYLGTNWFLSYAFEQFGIEIAGVKDLLEPSFDVEVSDHIFETFGRALGEFLFPYLIRLHSEGVVLGGKISLASYKFLPKTNSYLETMGYPVPIVISKLGEKSSLIGGCLSFIEIK